jgi:chemotaxis protein MotB
MPPKRKKPPEDPPKGNFELLFLQLMMIMMAFFILLSSLSIVVENKRRDALNSLAGAFSLMPAGANLDKGHGQSIPSREIGASKSATMRTAKALSKVAKQLGKGNAVHVLPLDQSRVLVRLPEPMLFAAGQIKLSPKIISFLNILSDILRQPAIQEITIEGHTDEIPVHTFGITDNWELSAARSMQVFRHLAAQGVPKSRMVVAGMGDAHPLPAKETKGDDALNRRVELLIRFRPTTVKNVNMLSPNERPTPRTTHQDGK